MNWFKLRCQCFPVKQGLVKQCICRNYLDKCEAHLGKPHRIHVYFGIAQTAKTRQFDFGSEYLDILRWYFDGNYGKYWFYVMKLGAQIMEHIH